MIGGMDSGIDPELDLTVTRIIRAPRDRVWGAWVEPRSFEQWWIPAPARCRVVEWQLKPGGAFVTEMSEGGGEFVPHLNACFLVVERSEALDRIVFTTSLVSGYRPAPQPFITAEFTFVDHPEGTLYQARALHATPEARAMHEEFGFYDGWGAVTNQLAAFVESARV